MYTQTPRSGRAAAVAVLVLLAAVLVAGLVFWNSRRSETATVAHDLDADQIARELAAAYFAQDSRGEAREAIAPLVERPDATPDDLVSAATIELSIANAEAARGLLERAERLAPDSPRVRYNLARLARLGLANEAALAHLEVALRGAPDDLPTLLMKAGALEDLDRVEEAERVYLDLAERGVDANGSWHLTALYRLSRIAIEGGDEARGTAYGEELALLKDRGLAAPSSAQLDIGVLGSIPAPDPGGTRPSGTGELPAVEAIAATLPELAGATALLAADLDNDGRLDLVGWGPSGVVCALNGATAWTAARVSPEPAEHLLAYDFGNDDDLDLLVTAGAAARLLVAEREDVGGDEDGPVRWAPWTRTLADLPSPALDVLALDYDHEGDLDLLFVGAFGARLLRDDGAASTTTAGGYTDVTDEAGLPTQRAFAWCVSEDLDTDQDVDLLLGGPGELYLASNARGGTFTDASERVDTVGGLPGQPVVADLDGDGRPDLWAAGAGLWTNGPSARLTRRSGYAAEGPTAGGGGPAVALDLDLDGSLDVVSRADGALRGRLALGLAEEQGFELALEGAGAVFAAADLDGDGALELVTVEGAGAVVHATRPTNKGVRLGYRGLKDNRRAVGAVVEVRSGPIYRRIYWRGEAQLVGVGEHTELDLVRVTWPNGVIQYDDRRELGDRASTADELKFLQPEGLVGSCPFLYTWNGETFEFISDVLGITPLGLPIAPGMLVPPDHDEYVLVRGEQLREKDGFLELQFTEELREVTYLDRARLDVIDHPAETEVYPNELFCFPPFPEPHTHRIAAPLSPDRAIGSDGGDWTAALAAVDGEYAAPFEPAPPQIQGIAPPHFLELEFDQAAVAEAPALRLVMTGWLYWSNASVNMAIARDERYSFTPPMFQVPDGEGGWRDTGPPVGFPAGKTKSMVIDVTDLLVREDPRIRVFSTLRLYWDSIRLAVDDGEAPIVTTSLEPTSAELWRRGFSEPEYSDRPHQPERFTWDRVSPIPRWNPHPGLYTRYGDVLPLLGAIEDQYAILGSGDALHVRFDARDLPPVPDGYRRDYLVFLDGWAKDRDPNTVEALHVEPLPFHGMSGYPYGPDESFPDDDEHRAWRREWNTRDSESWLPRLAEAVVTESER